MPNFIDLTGKRFGSVSVIERAENSARNEVMWRCRWITMAEQQRNKRPVNEWHFKKHEKGGKL